MNETEKKFSPPAIISEWPAFYCRILKSEPESSKALFISHYDRYYLQEYNWGLVF